MTTLFLSAEELHQLTGYQRNADQRRWLTARGWRFEVSAIGRPVVLRAHLQAKLSEEPSQPADAWTPNLAVMRRVA